MSAEVKPDILKVIEGILDMENENDADTILRMGMALMKAATEIKRLRAENADLRDRLMRATSGDPRTFGGF